MRGLKKNCMGRGQTRTETKERTSRLLERIGLKADSLKMLDEYNDDGKYIGDDSAFIDSDSEPEYNNGNYCLLDIMIADRKQEHSFIEFGPAGTVLLPPYTW